MWILSVCVYAVVFEGEVREEREMKRQKVINKKNETTFISHFLVLNVGKILNYIIYGGQWHPR